MAEIKIEPVQYNMGARDKTKRSGYNIAMGDTPPPPPPPSPSSSSGSLRRNQRMSSTSSASSSSDESMMLSFVTSPSSSSSMSASICAACFARDWGFAAGALFLPQKFTIRQHFDRTHDNASAAPSPRGGLRLWYGGRLHIIILVIIIVLVFILVVGADDDRLERLADRLLGLLGPVYKRDQHLPDDRCHYTTTHADRFGTARVGAGAGDALDVSVRASSSESSSECDTRRRLLGK